MQEASITSLLDELEKPGVNVDQLKRLYASGRQLDTLRERLTGLYQSHLTQHALNKILLAD